MFFPSRIKSIKEGYRVLEIGPGGTPHPRADVLLDLNPKLFKDEVTAGYQRGNTKKIKTSKPLIYYEGGKFPFKDMEFDYVICSHVLEHVEKPEQFLGEVFRIASKGYIEFPTIIYEYLYDIPVHLNLCYFVDKEIRYIKKKDTSFSDFSMVQKFFLQSLEKGYTDIVGDLKHYMFQGFEWRNNIPIRRVNSIKHIVPRAVRMKNKAVLEPNFDNITGSVLLLALYRKVQNKIKHKIIRYTKKYY